MDFISKLPLHICFSVKLSNYVHGHNVCTVSLHIVLIDIWYLWLATIVNSGIWIRTQMIQGIEVH